MSERVTESVPQEQQEQKTETSTAVKRFGGFAIVATAVAVLAVLGVAALFAEGQDKDKDKYSLVSPGGIAFSDFRGYEDWADVSSARQDDILKVIVANPAMIKAYKAGVPGNGQPFPEGSMIVKLQWKQKKDAEAQFAVDVPDFFTQAFVMEKDSKRFPKTGGWGYAVFNYDVPSDKFTPDPKSLADCGNACHTVVKAKDYIFHPYEKR
ncbi:MAG: cytochrome P460 family protein [Terriglobales bacterium]